MEEDAPEPEALLRKREVEDVPVPEALLRKRGYRGLAVGYGNQILLCRF